MRRNPLVEIVPLSTGCLGACTYCKTKHARGALGSYRLEDIIGEREPIGCCAHASSLYSGVLLMPQMMTPPMLSHRWFACSVVFVSPARVEEAVSEGVTEMWMSSEDTGAYGIDLGIR